MRIALATLVALLCVINNAHGFGLVLDGLGQLALDSDKLHGPSVFDYDGDGFVDLILMQDETLRVLELDGSTTWSMTLDRNAICPGCNEPGGYWDSWFYGFFDVAPGQRNAVVGYFWSDVDWTEDQRGVLLLSMFDGSIRHHLLDRGLDAAVDLDGDGIHEIVTWHQVIDEPSRWEVWGNQTPAKAASLFQNRLRTDPTASAAGPRSTTIEFELAQSGRAFFEVHDAQGRLIYEYNLGILDEGSHSFTWHGIDRWGKPADGESYVCSVRVGSRRVARQELWAQ